MFRRDPAHTALEMAAPSYDQPCRHSLPSIMAPVSAAGPGDRDEFGPALGPIRCHPLGQGARGLSPNAAWSCLRANRSLRPAKEFTFSLQAPSTPGYYTTDWRMLREGWQPSAWRPIRLSRLETSQLTSSASRAAITTVPCMPEDWLEETCLRRRVSPIGQRPNLWPS